VQLLVRTSGLLLYGGGLAVVLTVNDPVSLSDVPVAGQGRAAGLSATAEQFGSAFGIAVLCLAFTSATSPHFTPH
jgi:hypothetical protein